MSTPDSTADSSPARTGQVTMSYAAQYADPIAVRAGEIVVVSDQIDHWRDRLEWVWIWCTGPDGRAGWVPDAYIERAGAHPTIRRDYDATELTVETGEEVIVKGEESGWLRCVTSRGAQGWIPAENVALREWRRA